MFIEKKLNENLEDNLVVDSYDAKSYDKWVTNYENDDVPPAYMNYYLWNLTNLADVLEGGEPIVQQIGPYRYRKYFQKEDVVFLDDGNQVSYRERFFYIPESDNPPMDLKITAMNPAYMILVSKAGDEPTLLAGMTAGVFGGLISQLQSYTSALAVAQASALLIPVAQSDYLGSMTEEQFCSIWTNSTEVPSGFDIFGILSVENISSEVTFDQCHNLLRGKSYSMADSTPTGVSLWATFDTGNTTAIQTVQTIFGLNSYQVKLVSLWRQSFQSRIVTPFVVSRFRSYGVTNSSELGLVQWGQGKVLNGQSLGTLAGLTGIPEIYYWQTIVQGVSTPISFNLSRTKELLFGTYGLTNPTYFALFIQTVKKYDLATVQTLWGLNFTEAATIALYFQYVGQAFAKPIFVEAMNRGSGLFVTKTAQEWLWNGTDPLLALFAGEVASEYHLGKNNTISAQPSILYTGKDDLDKIAEYIKYDGVEEYCGVSTCGAQGLWMNDLDVAGTNGRNNKPKLKSQYVPTLWSSEFLRPIDFFFDDTDSLHGVKVYKYFIDETLFDPDPDFFQTVKGFGNLTHVSSAPVFVCQAHMYGVNETYQNKVKGQNPDPNLHRITLSVEPFSGATFSLTKRVQINGYVEPNTKKYSLFFPNIQTDIFFPLAYASEEAEISESAANDFKHSYYDTLTYQKVALWGGVAIGLAVVIVGFAITLRVLQKSRKLLDPNYDPLEGKQTA